MKNQDFYELGNQIQDIIQSAVDSRNYQELNQTIRKAMNTAVENGSEALKNALNGKAQEGGGLGNDRDSQRNTAYRDRNRAGGRYPGEDPGSRYRTQGQRVYTSGENLRTSSYQQPSFRKQKAQVRPAEVTKPSLYGGTTGEQLKGMMLTISGGILSSAMSLGLVVALIGKAAMGVNSLWNVGIGIMLLGIAGGAALLARGCTKLTALGRFKRYVSGIGDKSYSEFERLARLVGKPVKFVKRDIKKMIAKGWFLEGHVDKEETCLITTNDMYRQYQEAERQLEERKVREAPTVSVDGQVSTEVQEVLDKGNEYLVKIRKSNDAIPGEEISNKISRIEMLVQRIFQRVKEHPEVIPDLKKMMDYYLPMTVKLLDAYEDMDSQPVQGENIRSSKKEIEDTLDTLNVAFEKILDSIFRDAAWDVSSDISVLHTILAQEGLTENDFQQKSS